MKVQFDLNKWYIRPEYFNGLNRIAQLMIECPVARVEIQGHTCNIWTEKYNLKLSDMRATEVMNYLVKRGVEANRFLVRGFGLTMPTASNKTDQGREANRRAEFVRID
jgi:OOP family OmpA-OmpF porin